MLSPEYSDNSRSPHKNEKLQIDSNSKSINQLGGDAITKLEPLENANTDIISENISRSHASPSSLPIPADPLEPTTSSFSVENIITNTHSTANCDMSAGCNYSSSRPSLVSPSLLSYSRSSDIYRNIAPCNQNGSPTIGYNYPCNVEETSPGNSSPQPAPAHIHSAMSQSQAAYARSNAWYMSPPSDFTHLNNAEFPVASPFPSVRDVFDSQRILSQGQGQSSSCQLAAFRSPYKTPNAYACEYGKF